MKQISLKVKNKKLRKILDKGPQGVFDNALAKILDGAVIEEGEVAEIFRYNFRISESDKKKLDKISKKKGLTISHMVKSVILKKES
jgi:hypothetical protein